MKKDIKPQNKKTRYINVGLPLAINYTVEKLRKQENRSLASMVRILITEGIESRRDR